MYSLVTCIQAAGIGAGVAGGFTVSKLLSLSGIEIGIAPLSEPIETFIQIRSPNLLAYTQASAGLAIGVAVLSIILAFTVFLRVCCCKSGNTAVLCLVSYNYISNNVTPQKF